VRKGMEGGVVTMMHVCVRVFVAAPSAQRFGFLWTERTKWGRMRRLRRRSMLRWSVRAWSLLAWSLLAWSM